MGKKRGTRATYVVYGGREVKAIVDGKETGLSRDKNGVYYYMYDDPKTGTRKKKTYTTNIQIAYTRFVSYVDNKRAEEFIEVKQPKVSKKVRKKYKDSVAIVKLPNITIPQQNLTHPNDMFFKTQTKVSEKEYFEWLLGYRGREEELKRKSGISIKFLGRTDRVTHIKLQAILDYFDKHINFKTNKTRINYCKWFRHFMGFLGLVYVDDITEEHIRRYENEYLDAIRTANNFCFKWKNDRAGAIKKVFSFYIEKHPSTTAKVKEIRKYLMIWDRTKDKTLLDPQTVSVEDFWKLYNRANIRWKAILLFSLNTMSYAKDVSDTKVKHIDKTRSFLRMIREKENSLKVGYLWDETTKLIEQYERVKKGNSEWLFTSDFGGKYASQSMQNYIRTLSKRIDNLSVDNVTFEMLRNGSSTAADDGKIEVHYIEYGLGHQMVGSFSNYVKRRPERMKPVADNIYREYDVINQINLVDID